MQYRKCDSCGKTQSSKRWLSTSFSASELERFLVPASKKISELVRIGTELDFPHGTRVFIVASMNDDARIEVTEITQPPDSEAGQK